LCCLKAYNNSRFLGTTAVRPFDERLRNYADKRVSLDLEDGVKVE
jgi:hypothetical protein